MTYCVVFLLWTLVLYVIHVAAHRIPVLIKLHRDHHAYIRVVKTTKWHWSNLVLFNDTWKSTADLWITEVIPTVLISYLTGHWWVSALYYVWAATLQETLEHHPSVNVYPLTFGKWHLVHHRNSTKNFGLFIPVWDILFKTERKLVND